MNSIFRSVFFLALLFAVVLFGIIREFTHAMQLRKQHQIVSAKDTSWVAPSLFTENEPVGKDRELLIYGQELIAHTAAYLGPHGSVQRISNGMNCQNCHLDAGTRPWGNNYSLVKANYPKFRERSGTVENLYKRVNDCFERSLNGSPLDSNSREMQAISSYINWVGKDVHKEQKPQGSGIEKLPYLDRAADPAKGRLVYEAKCKTCHGANGEGVLSTSGITYTYPPLWGMNSYNNGAGLYRLSSFAGFVKNNMPFGQSSHQSPQLSTEEAWDVAAFVNSMPRPSKDQQADWPNIAKKPVDFPFGPYADSFSETQHKYGPFKPIIAFQNKGKG